MKFEQKILDSLRIDSVWSCPLCKSSERELFARDVLGGLTIEAVQCCSCGLIYMSSVVIKGDLHFLYESYNKDRNENDTELAKKRMIMYEIDCSYVRSFLKTEYKSILDIGCGEGKFLSMFGNSVRKSGVEIDSIARIAGLKQHTDISFFPTLEDIHDNQMFDVIVMRGTIQYMTDLSFLSDFCMRHLHKSGRIFILATPNADSLLARLQKEKWVLWNPIEHRYCFGLRQIQLLFKSCELIDYSLPYMKTPYENYLEDLKKVLDMFKGNNTGKDKFAFFGSMMNVILEKNNK